MIFEHRIWPDQPVNVSLPDDFGLDVIGTCMVTVCKDKTMAFELVNETEMKDRSSFGYYKAAPPSRNIIERCQKGCAGETEDGYSPPD